MQVTESVSLSANSSFSLNAVLESQAECESNLIKTIDCDSSLTYAPGATSGNLNPDPDPASDPAPDPDSYPEPNPNSHPNPDEKTLVS